MFFALYLNFIHKDKAFTQPVPVQTNAAVVNAVPQQENASSKTSATVLNVNNTEAKANQEALKLSIN
ncbi:MAG: hypothetical protein C4308_06705 [Chitinophagaceae bacterium]